MHEFESGVGVALASDFFSIRWLHKKKYSHLFIINMCDSTSVEMINVAFMFLWPTALVLFFFKLREAQNSRPRFPSRQRKSAAFGPIRKAMAYTHSHRKIGRWLGQKQDKFDRITVAHYGLTSFLTKRAFLLNVVYSLTTQECWTLVNNDAIAYQISGRWPKPFIVYVLRLARPT